MATISLELLQERIKELEEEVDTRSRDRGAGSGARRSAPASQ